MGMTKQQAIKLFTSVRALAEALEISRSAVYQWPETLPTDQSDRVMGAALRLGLLSPQKSMKKRAA